MARASSQFDRAAITTCGKGEISIWVGGTRQPADPETCQPCLNTPGFAPRTGEQAAAFPCPCRDKGGPLCSCMLAVVLTWSKRKGSSPCMQHPQQAAAAVQE